MEEWISRRPPPSNVYLDPTLHRALRVKAAETETSVSDLVNGAVRESLGEDAADLAVNSPPGRRHGLGTCRDASTPGRGEVVRAGEVSDPPRGLPVLYSIDDTAETGRWSRSVTAGTCTV